MSLLVFMGSGETAPAMVRIHKDIVARSGDGALVMLDTPFGFQNNADDLTARTQLYFSRSVGKTVDVARWRRSGQGVVEQESALAEIARARWLFAGPGSPTYALRHWADTAVPGAIRDLLRRGGTVVFGSAAAVTAGTHALPVYEIYKAGADATWATGLNLLGDFTGIKAAVIPHFDNAEGGTYDTRYCYLGEPRLAKLEALLPDDAAVLGVDEHTAVIVDIAGRTVQVLGNGGLTVRRAGGSTFLPADTEISLNQLASLVQGDTVLGSSGFSSNDANESASNEFERHGHMGSAQPKQAPSLLFEVSRLRAEFDQSVAQRDVEGAVRTVLDLESTLEDWSTDTLQSDETDQGRRELRAMIVRLGELAVVGVRDPRELVASFVAALLEMRDRARNDGDFATSDLIRDKLVAAGIHVQDTPDGVTWDMSARQ